MEMTLLERTAKLAEKLWEQLQSKGVGSKVKPVISIGGESGSGKTETALALYRYTKTIGRNPFILHQDDYYHLVPAENHKKRMEDIQWVGLQEVDFPLIARHIRSFREGDRQVNLQKIHFDENVKSNQLTDLSPFNILIVEGTYVSTIEEADYKIFLTHDYHQTIKNRLSRGREPFDPFVEEVLVIEHQIVKSFKASADIIVDHEYNIIT